MATGIKERLEEDAPYGAHYELADWQTGRLADWQTGRLADWQTGRLPQDNSVDIRRWLRTIGRGGGHAWQDMRKLRNGKKRADPGKRDFF
jgi:hypothetical protein